MLFRVMVKGIGYWWSATSNTSGYSLLLSLPSPKNKNLRKISLRFSFSSSCLTTYRESFFNTLTFENQLSSVSAIIYKCLWNFENLRVINLYICGNFCTLSNERNHPKRKKHLYIQKIWDHKSLCLPRSTLPHFFYHHLTFVWTHLHGLNYFAICFKKC